MRPSSPSAIVNSLANREAEYLLPASSPPTIKEVSIPIRRIKVVLAVVAAVLTMMAMAAPAMADLDISGGSVDFDISGGSGDAVGLSGADGGSSVGNVGTGSIDIGGLGIN